MAVMSILLQSVKLLRRRAMIVVYYAGLKIKNTVKNKNGPVSTTSKQIE